MLTKLFSGSEATRQCDQPELQRKLLEIQRWQVNLPKCVRCYWLLGNNRHIFTQLVIKCSHYFVCFQDYETEREHLAPEKDTWSMLIRLEGRDEDANPTLLWRKGGETHQAIWKHAESQGRAFPAWLFIATIYICVSKGNRNVLLVQPSTLSVGQVPKLEVFSLCWWAVYHEMPFSHRMRSARTLSQVQKRQMVNTGS